MSHHFVNCVSVVSAVQLTGVIDPIKEFVVLRVGVGRARREGERVKLRRRDSNLELND